jgi:hypothetical protein
MNTAEKFVAPQYLEKASQIKWLQNTERYGSPAYKYPFWFWPESIDDYDHKNQCHPFRKGVGPDEIHACAVWEDKAPGDFMFGSSPVFMEDYRGPNIIDIDKLPPEEKLVVTDEITITSKVAEDRQAAVLKAASIGRYNNFLYFLVGATALGVGLRYLEAKKRRK